MVKRFMVLLAAAFFIGFSVQAFAQEYRGDDEDDYFTYNVYGGYGFASLPNISTTLLDAIAFSYSAPVSGGKTIKNTEQVGPLFVGADYYFNDVFSMGGVFVYEGLTRRWEYKSSTDYTDWNWSFISLMGRVNLEYGWDYFKFYHSLMLGASRVGLELEDSAGNSKSSSDFIPAAHLVLLGIKVGKEFSVFADIGVGFMGLVNFGASISF